MAPSVLRAPRLHENRSVQEPVRVKHFMSICCGSNDCAPQLMVAARPKNRFLRQALRLSRFPPNFRRSHRRPPSKKQRNSGDELAQDPIVDLQRPNLVPKRTKAGRCVVFNIHPRRYLLCPPCLLGTYCLPAFSGQDLCSSRIDGVGQLLPCSANTVIDIRTENAIVGSGIC